MKKVSFLLMVAAVGATISMTSCSKKSKCTCTGAYSAYSFEQNDDLSDDQMEAACSLANLAAQSQNASCSLD